MGAYSSQEKIKIVECYLATKSITLPQRNFRSHFKTTGNVFARGHCGQPVGWFHGNSKIGENGKKSFNGPGPLSSGALVSRQGA